MGPVEGYLHKSLYYISTGGSLKAACLGEGQAVAREGFGDGLLTSIEYRLSTIAGSFVALAKKDSEGGSIKYRNKEIFDVLFLRCLLPNTIRIKEFAMADIEPAAEDHGMGPTIAFSAFWNFKRAEKLMSHSSWPNKSHDAIYA